MTCYDFRGIAVSPIISNVFEYCILEQFDKFLTSCDVQFGFKKVSVVEMQSILYIKLLRIGCRVGLRVLSGIAVGRWHSKSPRALGRDRFCHRIFAVYVDDVAKLFNVHFGTYIVLKTDDILLLAPSLRCCRGYYRRVRRSLTL